MTRRRNIENILYFKGKVDNVYIENVHLSDGLEKESPFNAIVSIYK